MKFNLFDESTWERSIVKIDVQQAITNKALGAIGQKINAIRDLREKLLKTSSGIDNKELQMALDLKASNPEAFRIMDIEIIYPNNEISLLIQDCSFIIDFWAANDTSGRALGWRNILPSLKRLEPYLEGDFFKTSSQRFEQLITIKVTGNAAWAVFYVTESNNKYYRLKVTQLQKEFEAYKKLDNLEF